MGKNSLNNFICHLSWLEKLSPTHTHPLISICEFLKPYELLFFEFEFWPTPPHPYMTHPTLPHPFMTHPTPPLYDTPHPPLHDPPTPPYPTPPLHDPPTPPHNHKIRVQECYGGRAMSCPWHVGGGGIGAPFGRHAALQLFH